MIEILPRYELYVVKGGYLGDREIIAQVPFNTTPVLEPGQSAYYIIDPEDEDLTLDNYAAIFDESAESDNYHDFIGVTRVIASVIAEEVGEGAAKRILHTLLTRYQGLHIL